MGMLFRGKEGFRHLHQVRCCSLCKPDIYGIIGQSLYTLFRSLASKYIEIQAVVPISPEGLLLSITVILCFSRFTSKILYHLEI